MEKLILIAEDDPKNTKLFRDLLRATGHRTIEVDNGYDAVQVALERQPDLILMDVSMPKLDGREATRLLKADPSTRRIPVLIVTAHALKDDREWIEQTGCDAYLTKPISVPELLQAVGRLMSEDASPPSQAATNSPAGS